MRATGDPAQYLNGAGHGRMHVTPFKRNRPISVDEVIVYRPDDDVAA
jgi:hypothetical protein